MKNSKRLLAGPYLFWAVSFIIIPLIMIFYYGLTDNDGKFTWMNLAKNIFNAIMVRDKLVNIVGAEFPCVDTGFGTNKPVDAVIRPEDIDLVKPEESTLKGVVTHLIFKGVHYEMEVLANNYEWLVHSTDMFPVGTEVGIHVDPFDIQIMKKPESEDEEAAGIEE